MADVSSVLEEGSVSLCPPPLPLHCVFCRCWSFTQTRYSKPQKLTANEGPVPAPCHSPAVQLPVDACATLAISATFRFPAALEGAVTLRATPFSIIMCGLPSSTHNRVLPLIFILHVIRCLHGVGRYWSLVGGVSAVAIRRSSARLFGPEIQAP